MVLIKKQDNFKAAIFRLKTNLVFLSSICAVSLSSVASSLEHKTTIRSTFQDLENCSLHRHHFPGALVLIWWCRVQTRLMPCANPVCKLVVALMDTGKVRRKLGRFHVQGRNICSYSIGSCCIRIKDTTRESHTPAS